MRSLLAGCLVSISCFGAGITYTAGSDSANFTILSNATLQVTLSNNSLDRASSVQDILTGFFVELGNSIILTPVSADAASIINCLACSLDVSSHWGYSSGVVGLSANPVHLISTTLVRSSVPSTYDYGIIGASANFSTGQAALTGSPLVSQSVVFLFNTSPNFSYSSIGLVGFLHGEQALFSLNGFSDLTEAPEPVSYALIGFGLIAIGFMKRTSHSYLKAAIGSTRDARRSDK